MCFWTMLVDATQVCDGLGADEFWAPDAPYPEFLSGVIEGTDPWSGSEPTRLFRVYALRNPDHSLVSFVANESTTPPTVSWTGGGSPYISHAGSNEWRIEPSYEWNGIFTVTPASSGLTTAVGISSAYGVDGPIYGGNHSFEYIWLD